MIKEYKILILLISAILLWYGCNGEKGPEQIVRDYVKAHNSHEIDNAMGFFDENTVFEIPGSGMSLTGPEDIREMAQYDSVIQTNLTILEMRVEGKTVICKVRENNRWLETAGVDPLVYDSTMFFVLGGKIRKIIAYPADSSIQNMSQAMDSFLPWLVKNHPREMAEMMPAGQFRYTPENAEKMLDLLARWRETDTTSN